MLETFINLATALAKESTITDASMSASNMITIDGITDNDEKFYLTYRTEKAAKHVDP